MPIAHSLNSSLARMFAWALGIFVFLTFIGLDRTGPSIRIDDKQMERQGAFAVISLAPYSGHTAAFTREPNATLIARLPAPATVTAFSIRVYNYGKGANRFTVSLDGAAPITVDMPQTAPGQGVLRHVLATPVSVQTVRIAAQQIGQDTALIDHLDLETEGLPVGRLLDLALLSLIFAAILAFAPRILVVHAASTGRNYLFIDYMRGIAATLVLLLHARGYSQLPDFPGNGWYAAIAKNGHLGVEIFYFVSAYTLTLSLLGAQASDQKRSTVLEFWLRRLARIMPAFLFVMLIMVAVRPLMYPEVPASTSLGIVLRHVFMTYVFQDPTLNHIIQHSAWWSISTELQFYILLPALASGAWLSIAGTGRLPLTQRVLIGLGLYVFGVAIAAFMRKVLAGVDWSPYMALYHFDVFAAGIGLAVILNGRTPPERKPAAAPVRWALTASWIILLLCVVAFFHSYTGLAVLRPFGMQLLDELASKRALLAFGLGLVVLLADWTERYGAATPASPFRVVGVLSFIVYLVHIPALQITQRYLVSSSFAGTEQVYAATIVTALIVCMVLGLGIHRLVEAPGMNAVRNPRLRPALLGATHVYVIIVAFLFFWIR